MEVVKLVEHRFELLSIEAVTFFEKGIREALGLIEIAQHRLVHGAVAVPVAHLESPLEVVYPCGCLLELVPAPFRSCAEFEKVVLSVLPFEVVALTVLQHDTIVRRRFVQQQREYEIVRRQAVFDNGRRV